MVKFVNCLRGGYAKDENGDPVLLDGVPIRELFEVPEGMDPRSFFQSLPPEKQQDVLAFAEPKTRAFLGGRARHNDGLNSLDGLGVIPVAHPVGTEALD